MPCSITVIDDFERCYRFIQSQDPRYDGHFVVAVTSTGIYCRPSCPARTPQRANVRLFPTTAAAQKDEAAFLEDGDSAAVTHIAVRIDEMRSFDDFHSSDTSCRSHTRRAIASRMAGEAMMPVRVAR